MKTPIAIIGLGISGKASLELLLAEGCSKSDIILFDQKDPSAEVNNPEELKKRRPQSLVVSPGVPLSSPWIKDLLSQGATLTSELELAFRHISTEKIIAITGAVGKSTTTAMIGAAAKTQDPNAFVGGNLGFPLAHYAKGLLEKGPRAQYVVLELSSYQLENFKNLRADVGIITYLTPNHMERYSSLESYYQTKLSLLEKTKGFVVLNKNGGDLSQKKISGTWTDRNDVVFPVNILGLHNKDNLAIALKVCDYFQWGSSAIEALKKFPGLPHRLENLGLHKNVLFINDSKATAIDSVLQAVQSIQASQRLVLLLGGKDKNLPWEQLKTLKNVASLQIIYFGEYSHQAKGKVQIEGPLFSRLHEALDFLKTFLQAGDTVLLSPGGTSLDEFKSFEERGNFFKAWVSKY